MLGNRQSLKQHSDPPRGSRDDSLSSSDLMGFVFIGLAQVNDLHLLVLR